MRLVTRYILREHVGPLFFAVTTLTSLLLLNYISKRFGDLVGKGLSWDVIAEFFLLSIPFTIAMTLPMAVLIATLYAFSRLAGDREIIALMSCGVGTRQLLMPVAGFGVVLSLTMIWFNDQLLPRANQRLSSLSSSIAQKKPTLALKPQTLNEVSQGRLYIWMSRLDQSKNLMRSVTIYDLNDAQIHRTIVADSGTLAFAANGRDLLLTLHTGYIQETRNAPKPEEFRRMFFTTDILRVRDVANTLTRSDDDGYKGDREMTVCEMQAEVAEEQGRRDSTRQRLMALEPDSARRFAERYGSRLGEWYCAAVAAVGPKPAEAQGVPRGTTATQATPARQPPVTRPRGFAGAGPDPAAKPTQVMVMTQELMRAEQRINVYEVEIQKKFAISLACLVFALLGPPIALRFPRAGVGLTIGVSLVVFAVYYIGLIAGERLGDKGTISPVAAMWAANVIFAAVAGVLAYRMGREGAAPRDASLRELLDRIRPGRSARRAA